MTKTILVTGCAGFIGTNLCLRLLKEGNVVIGVDNFCSGQRKNIDTLSLYENFYFEKMDVSDYGFYNDFIFNFSKAIIGFDLNLDEIYHLACPASPPTYQKNPIATMITGVVGTKNVLDLAVAFKCKMLFTSTSEVYGDPEVSPQPESYRGNVNPYGIRSCYDESKRAAECLMYDYKRTKNVDIRVARIFNTSGPYMSIDDGRVVTNFIKQALNNESITIYGNGTQSRSFCYIDDQVDGLIALMNSNCWQTPINIGNTDEITMLQLATEIIELTNSRSVLEFKPLPKDDPKQRRPDISLAKRILNWEPKVSRIDGLKKTIEYFKEQLNESQD